MNDVQREEVLQLLSEMTHIVQQIAVCGEATCMGMDGLMSDMDANMTALRKIHSWSGETEEASGGPVKDERGSGLAELVIYDKMKELGSTLDMSMKMLRKRLIEVENELKAARQSKRALNAYSNTV